MPPRKLTKPQVEQAIKLTASGVDCRAVGRVLDVSHTTVRRYLNSPEASEKLKLLRESIKHTIMERTADELIGGAAKVAQVHIEANDAKGLDAATRAILNLEKASSSAAGEGKRMEVTGPGGAPLQVDVRALIAQIVAHNADNPDKS
jgi:predicted transcriptional regulator